MPKNVTMIIGIAYSEWIGYMASAVVLISFLMKKIRMLRMINILGCGLFVAYGFSLDISWPIVFTNIAIMLINIIFLIKLAKTKNIGVSS